MTTTAGPEPSGQILRGINQATPGLAATNQKDLVAPRQFTGTNEKASGVPIAEPPSIGSEGGNSSVILAPRRSISAIVTGVPMLLFGNIESSEHLMSCFGNGPIQLGPI
jgi:hypothetical protein